MKRKGLVFGALAVLIITALSAGVASAQDNLQTSHSADVTSPPINVSGSGTTDITSSMDTGTKQSSMFIPGQTSTKNTPQTLPSQPKHPREKGARNKDNATPTEAAPNTGNSPDPGSSDPGNSTNPGSSDLVNPPDPGGSSSSNSADPGSSFSEIKELPKTGGAKVPMLGIVGMLLVAGGLLVRRALR